MLIQNSIFEDDSETIINALRLESFMHSSFSHIISDVLSSTSSLQSFFFFPHTCRQDNSITNALSREQMSHHL